jgi:hypothetical protein
MLASLSTLPGIIAIFSPPRHDRADKDREELHALVAQIMSFTNVAFFGLAGASLKLVCCWQSS